MKWCLERSTAVRALLGAVAAIAFLVVAAAPASASIQFDGQFGSFSPLGLDGTFNTPSRAATDSSGNVYVTDSGNSRVQKFSSTGTFSSKFGSLGAGNGQFLALSALGVVVDSSGNSYVVDKLGSRVEKFNASGTFVLAWGSAGTNDGQFATPSGIATDGAGHIYVADTGNNRIQEFDSSGNFVTKWGSVGSGNGQFTSPTGVAVDSTGDVYVADSGNSRIEKFTSSGTFITKWGSAGTGDGQFGATATVPLDLAVGPSDNVVVVDATNNRVEKFRPIGTFITKWGTAGSGTSQFTLPSGVAVASGGEVYIVDQGNNRVERFHETDVVPPTSSLDSGPSGTSGPNVSFSFSSPDSPLLGPGFECRFDTAEWESCGSPKAYSNLSDGSHTFRERAVDAAGNPDPNPLVRTWTVDAIPPQTTIDLGPSGTIGDAGPSFSFSSSESPSTFECRIDSGSWQSCSSPKAYSNLSDGSHTFDVRATDAVGNTDLSPASRTFTVDTTPPQTMIDSGPSGTTNDTSPSFSFSSEAGASFECRLDSGSWQSCSSPKSYSNLSDGSHTFDVRASDAVGNTDLSPASRTWTIDATPPQTTIDSGPSGLTSDASPSFGFSSEPGASFECRLDSGSWQSCTSPKSYSNLSDGSHTFDVRATDAVGNTESSPASRSFTVDTTPPETTVDSGPSGLTNNASPSFGFSSSEPSSTFECRIDSGSWQGCTSPQAYSSLADGSHTFEVRATDQIGNLDSTPASRGFTVDTQAPPAPRITATDPASPANNNNPKVKGNAQAGSRVKIYKVAGCTGNPVARGRAGVFHSTGLEVTVPDNTTTSFRATATDPAGNTSPCSPLRKYVEDSKAPTAPSINGTTPGSPANNNQPRVRGFAQAPSTIKLYTTVDCTGAPVTSGTASLFHSPGLSVSVADNTTTAFRATATDPAGNTSPCSAARSYVEDSLAPETTITSGPSSQTTDRRPTFKFASSEAGSIFRCGFDSQPFGRCSGPGASHTPYVALAFGSHIFRVRAVDPAGNIDTSPAKRTFAVVP
jgi:hypothetical protein